ncbi:MAG: hypothetical protein ACYC99_04210 [Candidatus Geothermincolia bacterium]
MKICEEGVEEYSVAAVIDTNLAMVLWIALGTDACYFFSHIVAWVYLGIAVLLVFVVLRKLVCTNCYYYGKRCATGWGKLASMMFKRGDIERFNDSIGVTLAPVIYGLLTVVPLVLGTIATVMHFSWLKVLVLAGLALVGFYSGSVGRKKSCKACKMREYCKGSAAGRAREE